MDRLDAARYTNGDELSLPINADVARQRHPDASIRA